MADDPRSWFMVDADLWQEERSRKLTWYQRRVAIYLRKRSGVYGDGDEARPNIVLSGITKIALDTGLTYGKVQEAIARLRRWPSRRRPFIQQFDKAEAILVLRPLPRKFVRCSVSFWDSAAPADLQDVLFFVKSQFNGKKPDGTELFVCNLYGTKRPSIIRCCYLSGANYQARRQRLKVLVKVLMQCGLLKIEKWSTRNSPMVVRLDDEKKRLPKATTPLETGLEACETADADMGTEGRSAYQSPDEVHSKHQAKCIAKPREVQTFSESVFQSPYLHSPERQSPPPPNPHAAPQHEVLPEREGEGHFISEETRMTDIIRERSSLPGFLEWCAGELEMDRGRLSYEAQVKNLLRLMDRMPEEFRSEFLASDFLEALVSHEWGGMTGGLGVRLSEKYGRRLLTECCTQIEYRNQVDESQVTQLCDEIIDVLKHPDEPFRINLSKWDQTWGVSRGWLKTRLAVYQFRFGEIRLPPYDAQDWAKEETEFLTKAERVATEIWKLRNEELVLTSDEQEELLNRKDVVQPGATSD